MEHVINKLLAHPEKFEFYQAVRILEEYLKMKGFDEAEIQEKIRFKHNASFAFPVTEIQKISNIENIWEITINFMGLIGPTGLLPNHHTATVIERLQQKDNTLRDFLDIFQHRLAHLYYAAWKKNYFNIYTTKILYSLIGQGTPYLQQREQVSDEILLYYAAHFLQHSTSVTGLKSILSDYFSVPINIKSFQKKKLQLQDNERSTLGKNTFNQLGINTNCGNTQAQYLYHFSVIVGPVDKNKFESFFPNQDSFKLLVAITKRYVGLEFSFDIRLVLKSEVVPFCQIGSLNAARLGWNSWLKLREFLNDADNTVLHVRS